VAKVWRQLADDFANESVANSAALATISRHGTTRRTPSCLFDEPRNVI
jgi:hypothetical protein